MHWHGPNISLNVYVNFPETSELMFYIIRRKTITNISPELKTLELDILNPVLLINLQIKFMRSISNI